MIHTNVPEFETAVVRQVYCNEDGSHVDVREDGDGLGCVEVVYIEKGAGNTPRLTFPPKQARLVAKAILALCDELEHPIDVIKSLASHFPTK